LASDHGDTPLLRDIGRNDARLTDLYAFQRGTDLVIVVGVDPTVSETATSWTLPSDVQIRVMIDNDSEVTFDDAQDLAQFGGTITQPDKIREDVAFTVRRDDDGELRLSARGLRGPEDDILFFAGLRDDPFIRAPRSGRNVGAIVVSIPMARILGDQDTLLLWATSAVDGVHGPFQELTGRALRSMFPENDLFNVSRPGKHLLELGVQPDVMIYDTSRPAAFPNGRELADDVVDLVGDERVLANDAPFPVSNDIPWLPDFPYLPEPHAPD
jgi:hypothetical protein